MEMIISAVVEEAVKGAVSFVFSSHKETVSQEDLMERLEMAHIHLDLALERARMMPVTIIALLRKRKKLKDVFKECDDLLDKARGRQQVVPSLRKKLMHTVLPSFIVPCQHMLSSSVVRRFEWFAKEADKFVRDIESGCSLSNYRFLNPLIRHLLEGKKLCYHKVQGSQTRSLFMWTVSVEDYDGTVLLLDFQCEDQKAPYKSFELPLILRLYESTNIIGVVAKCLNSLGPQFKSVAEVATGELIQIPTQDITYHSSVDGAEWLESIVQYIAGCNPDPLCCISNGLDKPCAKNIISSELTGRFPQEVMAVAFYCRFSASEYWLHISTDEAHISIIKAMSPLGMIVSFLPHLSENIQDGSSLHKTEEEIRTKAIDYFIHQPHMTRYRMFWDSAHGHAKFLVSKPVTKTRRAPKKRR